MPCSGRPSKERRAAPPFPIWTRTPQSSPMVAPVWPRSAGTESSSCRPDRCPTRRLSHGEVFLYGRRPAIQVSLLVEPLRAKPELVLGGGGWPEPARFLYRLCELLQEFQRGLRPRNFRLDLDAREADWLVAEGYLRLVERGLADAGAVHATGLHLEEIEGPATGMNLEEGEQFPGANESFDAFADETEPLFAQ